jgi:hypothetical protein
MHVLGCRYLAETLDLATLRAQHHQVLSAKKERADEKKRAREVGDPDVSYTGTCRVCVPAGA